VAEKGGIALIPSTTIKYGDTKNLGFRDAISPGV